LRYSKKKEKHNSRRNPSKHQILCSGPRGRSQENFTLPKGLVYNGNQKRNWGWVGGKKTQNRAKDLVQAEDGGTAMCLAKRRAGKSAQKLMIQRVGRITTRRVVFGDGSAGLLGGGPRI